MRTGKIDIAVDYQKSCYPVFHKTRIVVFNIFFIFFRKNPISDDIF